MSYAQVLWKGKNLPELDSAEDGILKSGIVKMYALNIITEHAHSFFISSFLGHCLKFRVSSLRVPQIFGNYYA